jgi:hypothetical protein
VGGSHACTKSAGPLAVYRCSSRRMLTNPRINYVVTFEHERGFFMLDDADLPSWLPFPALASGHILYEVSGDGWLHAQPSGSLAVASAQCREWLVATGNECVSVFSAAGPSIQRLDHAAT